MRFLSYYGDDFTGSTDVMEALASHGIRTVLFTRIPTAEEFAPYRDFQAVGLAGTSRSQSPAWMVEHLPGIFRWLQTLDAQFCHYKVCSTFDSSPQVGNIGRAMEIAANVFNQQTIALVVGAPQLKRQTFAGNLFAAYQGDVYRIDRHPVMSRHPVTPMHESDLRLHLQKQTGLAVRLATDLSQQDGVELIDVYDLESQLLAGRKLLSLPSRAKPFVCGSSGVEYALVKALEADENVRNFVDFPVPKVVERLLVLSGSVSATTERQIRFALADGFTGVEAKPDLLASSTPQGEIQRLACEVSAILEKGGSPIVHTALGPNTHNSRVADHNPNAIGTALGSVARHCIERFQLSRIVFAGGDTSSHALSELDVFAMTMRYPLVNSPGSPLCTAQTTSGVVMEIALKGGQVGNDDYFVALRDATL